MTKKHASLGDALTDREGEVWSALASDAPVSEIREALKISGPTLSYHVNALKTKLGCRTIVGLVIALLESAE
jgi:DNA-binding CsgD family transcriptional regulator